MQLKKDVTAPLYECDGSVSRLQSHIQFLGDPGTQLINLTRMKG